MPALAVAGLLPLDRSPSRRPGGRSLEAGLPAADPEYARTYLHARYFDPQLGQFLSPDPIGPAGGVNSFAYGFGDPINMVDAGGLFPDIVLCQPQPYCRGGNYPGGRSPVDPGIGIPIIDWLLDFFFGGRPDPNPGSVVQRPLGTILPGTPGSGGAVPRNPPPSSSAPDPPPVIISVPPPGQPGPPRVKPRSPITPSPAGQDFPEQESRRQAWMHWYAEQGYTPDELAALDAWDDSIEANPAVDPINLLIPAGAIRKGWLLGQEIRIGRNLRIAPLGNRTGHPIGRWPHYHRRGVGPGGVTRPGQGISRHRPWQVSPVDKSWLERF